MITKTKIFFGIYALLIAAVAFIAWQQRGVSHSAKLDSTPTEKSSEAQEQGVLRDYKDDGAGYSFKYPSNIFEMYDKVSQVPFLNRREELPTASLVHTVPVEHCDLSGLPEHCTPTTTDISISFTPVDYSLNLIKTAKGGIDLEPITVNGVQGLRVDLGVEGEGRIDYYVPLDTSRTLWISRTYINEDVVGGYKNAPKFIPYPEQAKIFNALLNSLHLSNYYVNYVSDELAYSFLLPKDSKISPISDPSNERIQVLGPEDSEGDHMPWIDISHYTTEFYLPTTMDVRDWLASRPDGQPHIRPTNMANIIDWLPTAHYADPGSIQHYPADSYYVIVQGRLIKVSIMHDGGKRNSKLYNEFLDSFHFFKPEIDNSWRTNPTIHVN
jgi:hypothetical protein